MPNRKLSIGLTRSLTTLLASSCVDGPTATVHDTGAASAGSPPSARKQAGIAKARCRGAKFSHGGEAGPPAGKGWRRFCAPLDPALEEVLGGATDADTLEVIVNFDGAQTTERALTDAVLRVGAGVIQFRHLSMLAARVTVAQVAAIRALPGVQSVYLNRQLQYLLAESVEAIRADAVHALGITGRGVGIAILDSGIDGLFNPDVAYPTKTIQNVKAVADLRALFTFANESGVGSGPINQGAAIFIENLPNSETSTGHGTHVAGIAAGNGTASGGKYTGVAPGASLIGIGAGDALFLFWVLAGFDYILEHRQAYNIQVVNNSWGTIGEFDPDDPINEATRAVHDAGIAVVFAAGNTGPRQNTLNPYSVAPWAISVAAGCKLVNNDPTSSTVRCSDGRDRLLADFSSRGIPGDALYHPDITAPGVRIVAARALTGVVMTVLDLNEDALACAIAPAHVQFYTCASGTSMAAPHVAGVIALLEEASGGTLTPDQALEVITRTARPLAGYALWEVGAGYLDALAAVEAVRR
jgi:serine protease AprX